MSLSLVYWMLVAPASHPAPGETPLGLLRSRNIAELSSAEASLESLESNEALCSFEVKMGRAPLHCYYSAEPEELPFLDQKCLRSKQPLDLSPPGGPPMVQVSPLCLDHLTQIKKIHDYKTQAPDFDLKKNPE